MAEHGAWSGGLTEPSIFWDEEIGRHVVVAYGPDGATRHVMSEEWSRVLAIGVGAVLSRWREMEDRVFDAVGPGADDRFGPPFPMGPTEADLP